MQLYSCGSMIVQTVLMEIEFDKTLGELSDRTIVGTSAAREHVTKIERQICTTKERCHTVVSTFPFEVIPQLIATHIVYFVVLWLNAFPVQNGVSKVYSPRSIVIRSWNRHCKVLFCTYFKVHDKPDPSNDMTP